MPQKLSTDWQKMLGENWQDDHVEYLHTIGNLTLTGYNSELSNRSFDEKKKLLAENGAKIKELNLDVFTQDVWNVDAIKSRSKRLTQKVVSIFGYPENQVDISFKDPRYKEYSCENTDDATGKSIEYFILQGEKVYVNSFAEMLRIVIQKLYEQDPDVIEEMARNNKRIISWSKTVMFSYDDSITNSKQKIQGTNIYESKGTSSAYIMCVIKSLLENYGIDFSEFSYSARNG